MIRAAGGAGALPATHRPAGSAPDPIAQHVRVDRRAYVSGMVGCAKPPPTLPDRYACGTSPRTWTSGSPSNTGSSTSLAGVFEISHVFQPSRAPKPTSVIRHAGT